MHPTFRLLAFLELPELLDHKVIKDLPVLLERPAFRVFRVHLVLLELRELSDLLDHRVFKDLQV